VFWISAQPVMNNAVNAVSAVNVVNEKQLFRIALNIAGVYAIQQPLPVKSKRKNLRSL
jgi:hypothetical protein